jgi:hypothetical protein
VRRWIEEGLAICLIALLVQVFAPVGASFAMAAADDPLNAPICEHGGNTGSPQHPAAPGDDGSCCTLCAFVHAGVAPPPALPVAVLLVRQPIRRPLLTPASAPPAQRWITRLAQPRAPPSRS